MGIIGLMGSLEVFEAEREEALYGGSHPYLLATGHIYLDRSAGEQLILQQRLPTGTARRNGLIGLASLTITGSYGNSHKTRLRMA